VEFNDLINKNTKLKKNFQKVKTKIKLNVIEGITNNSTNVKKNLVTL